MNRNEFVKGAFLSAFSISMFGSVVKSQSIGFKGDCETTSDILGPYYRENAPFRSDLIKSEVQGTPLIVEGRVLEPDCQTPIKNAIVEIWHCDSEGRYDMDTEEYKYRAQLCTDILGKYSFSTILPGKYLLQGVYRPAHIHFRVTGRRHKELISQIYFKGDPKIENDRWASLEKAKKRIIPITPIGINGEVRINFDIYLQES